MPLPLLIGAGLGIASGLKGLFGGGGGQQGIQDLPPWLKSYLEPLQQASRQFGYQAGEKRYFTGPELANYLNSITRPDIARLQDAYAPMRERAVGDYANRGQLFGGSLTGALGNIENSYGRNLADLLSRAEANVSGLDIQYGQQRSLAGQQGMLNAQQIIAQLIGQHLSGQYGVQAARTGRPSFLENLLGPAATFGAALVKG